jgi:NAD(P)H-quinone oxidoreductase subunit I
MTEEYELSIYNHHDLNYDQIALGRLPISVIEDSTIKTISNFYSLSKGNIKGHSNSRNVTIFLG